MKIIPLSLFYVISVWASSFFTYLYLDVEASQYHEASKVCEKTGAKVIRFDTVAVKCDNGGVFNITEMKK